MCQQHLDAARGFWFAAGSAIAGSTATTIAAIVANGGFFTAPAAPALMIVTAGLAAAAAGSLIASGVELLRFQACGGVPKSCEGKFRSLLGLVAGAITTQVALGYAALAAASVSWIPWVGIPALAAMLAAIIVQAGLIVGFGISLATVSKCLIEDSVRRTSGGLRGNEKSSDPWFLRVHPLTGDRYEQAVGPRMIEGTERVSGGAVVWHCADFSAQTWRIAAEAVASGAETAVAFVWTVDSKVVGGNDDAGPPPSSQLLHELPTGQSNHTVTVTARDASGFTRSETFTVDAIAPQFQRCRVDLPYAPFRQTKVLAAVLDILRLPAIPDTMPRPAPASLSERIGRLLHGGVVRVVSRVLPTVLRMLGTTATPASPETRARAAGDAPHADCNCA
jgi:hypothetical protein